MKIKSRIPMKYSPFQPEHPYSPNFIKIGQLEGEKKKIPGISRSPLLNTLPLLVWLRFHYLQWTRKQKTQLKDSYFIWSLFFGYLDEIFSMNRFADISILIVWEHRSFFKGSWNFGVLIRISWVRIPQIGIDKKKLNWYFSCSLF